MTDTPIPVWSYEAEYAELRDQILAACDRVFKSNRLVLGQEGEAFEAAMARAAGVTGAVGVNSGTDAILIALAALGVKAGDEVITVPNTAVPTCSAIGTLGARPRFVDVNADFLMDVSKVEAAITDRTRAIVPVHLYGQCVDMDPLLELARKHGLKVMEDVAQAQGALYKGKPAGSLGDAASFSFYPTKILGGYGDGGMILSNDQAVLDMAKSLRFYGMETVYYSERHGYNSRLDEVQAAILSLKLPQVPSWIARRREIAKRYTEAFAGTAVTPPRECDYGQHCFYIYVVEHEDRDGMIERLAARNIMCNVSYRWPIHSMRGYAHLDYGPGDFPMAEAKANRIFSLPMHPYLTNAEVTRVIAAVRDVM
ncbi:MAG: DegT/DnrJ/EryC1/StrS family aminotransferase [Brevundimonas sp.]|uniref:DegT/DnrJ/EryC1/StrS family aminotransferase n=1 Tax=Brevundimonas sp. TaxID=1871086 RepID=UPI00391B7613